MDYADTGAIQPVASVPRFAYYYLCFLELQEEKA
jgi:hypothetical protein